MKLDNRRGERMFVKCTEQSKAYKMYNRVTKKKIKTRDVKFLEDHAWSKEVEGNVGREPFLHVIELVDTTRWKEPVHKLPQLHVQE